MQIEVKRLSRGDGREALMMFRLMGEVFDEGSEAVSEAYTETLLSRPNFWALAVYADGRMAGGITAHTLPMTRREAAEVFIYDIAVHQDLQRRGIGRRLMEILRELAASENINVAFVAADDEDQHALDFYRALGGEPAPVTVFTFANDGS